MTRRVRAPGVTPTGDGGLEKQEKPLGSPLSKVDQAAFNRHLNVPSSSGRMLPLTGRETPVRIRAGQPKWDRRCGNSAGPGSATPGIDLLKP